MNRYSDIDPMDIDPDTGRPYSNYSSPSLDTSFHDGEMDRAISCLQCGGQGGVGLPDKAGRYLACPRCGGTGEDPGGSYANG